MTLAEMKAKLDRFWFPEVSSTRLAVVRCLCGGYVVYFLLRFGPGMLRHAGGAPETFIPVGVAGFLQEPMPPWLYGRLLDVTLVFAYLFTLGLWHRVVGPLFAALFLFVVTYSNSWAMVYHTENMLVLHVIILGLTPAASAVSLGSLLSEGAPKWLQVITLAKPADTEPHWRFGWAIRMLQLGATLPYVVAGLAKVLGDAGISWALGSSLRDQITMNGLYYELYNGGADEITFHVYGWDTAFFLAATLTLVLELGAPLALLHRYAGYLFVAGIMGMHWGILILMGIPFRYQLWGIAFACLFEWEQLLAWLEQKFELRRNSPAL